MEDDTHDINGEVHNPIWGDWHSDDGVLIRDCKYPECPLKNWVQYDALN